MKTCQRVLLHMCIILTSCLMLPALSFAGVAPEILRLDTIMQDNEVRVTVAWNSDVPVTKIIASGGKSMLEIENTEADPIINKRTSQGGYTGTKSFTLQSKNVAIVKSYKSEQYSAHYVRQGNTSVASAQGARSSEPYQEVVVVTVQLIDKYAAESATIRRDVPTVVELAAQPAPAITSAEINITPTPIYNQNPVQNPQNPQDAILGIGINAANKILAAPQATISNVQELNGIISITASATASKPIQQFIYEITDTQNSSNMFSGSFDCSNGLECKDRHGESSILEPSTYNIIVKVRDGDGREATSAWDGINVTATASR
ncbi:MAG: hypothetical protein ACOYL3_21565 [Desulfuromonadaceae bacterium]